MIIGCCLQFRAMLQIALREVAVDTVPLAVAAMDQAAQLAKALTPHSTDSRVATLVRLAASCGAPVEFEDYALRDTLRRFKVRRGITR